MTRKHDHPELLLETVGLYEQALRLDPSSVLALCHLANALINRVVDSSNDQGDENYIERATAIIATAATIEPNNEELIHCQGYLFRALGRWAEAIATYERLLELFPSNASGHRQLGFCKLAIGQPEAAIPLLQRSIRLDPFTPNNRYAYRRIGWSLLLLGHDADSIQWQQRTLAADAMAPALERGTSYLLMAAAHALIGESDYAHRAVIEGSHLRPFVTVRTFLDLISQRGLLDRAHVSQMVRVQEGLRAAGLRDHADEDADFGVKPDAALHQGPFGLTPTSVPGGTTLRTSELVDLLAHHRPILLDVALHSCGRSLPGAIGLQGTGHGTSFSDSVQNRFSRKIHDLTNGDLSVPIVAFCANSERFTGYNLALRLVALGHSQVFWYRGGWEAWQVNGLPESDLRLQDW